MAEPKKAAQAAWDSGSDVSEAWESGEDVPPEAPDESSVAAEPFGPEAEPPSTWKTLRGMLPTEADVRGAIASFAQGPTMNWADEAAGLMGQNDAALRYMRDGGQKPNLEQAYRDSRDKFRGVESGFRDANPKTAFGLTVAGGMLAPNPGGASAAFGNRVAGAAISGAASGAGATDEREGMGLGAAVGAPLGVAGQAIGEGAGELLGRGLSAAGRGIKRFATGLIEPSDAAKYLESKGVNGLTLGQMNPNTPFAQIEEASTTTAGLGQSIKGQRDVGRTQWQDAVLNMSSAPGMGSLNPADDVADRLGQSYGAFGSAYDSIRDVPVATRGLGGLIDAVDDPSILANSEQRSTVARFLENQMTTLDGRLVAGASGPTATAGDLIAIRSGVREAIRDASKAEDYATANLLKRAEEQLTASLEEELPDAARDALRAADGAYGTYKTIEAAVGKAGDQPGGLSPTHLSRAVQQSTPPGFYARGGGGELRTLASAGKEVLDAKIPMTGARLLATSPVPHLVGPFAYVSNLPGPKQVMLGRTDWQQSLASQDWLSTLASTQPEVLGKWGQYLGRAAAQSPEALSSAHFEAAQADPDYQKRLRALGEEQQ